ncbi:MAG: Bax inhibitor-1/YccA family protein [Acidimicrobiales bacterium]
MQRTSSSFRSDSAQYHGIVAEAVGATFGVALVVWFLYGTGIIKVTARLTRIITMAVLGAIVFYGVTLLVMAFGGPDLDGSGGIVGIGISLVLAAVAASTFLLAFDRIDKLIAAGAGHGYDWYGAFGLLISFIWLYLEILKHSREAAWRRRVYSPLTKFSSPDSPRWHRVDLPISRRAEASSAACLIRFGF